MDAVCLMTDRSDNLNVPHSGLCQTSFSSSPRRVQMVQPTAGPSKKRKVSDSAPGCAAIKRPRKEETAQTKSKSVTATTREQTTVASAVDVDRRESTAENLEVEALEPSSEQSFLNQSYLCAVLIDHP